MLPPPSTQTVASLLGHAQVDTAIACLGSLLAYSADSIRLRLHDDGSLTEGDRDRLSRALGDVVYVGRPEADDRVADLLARRPALAAYRRESPLALKLVDTVLFSEGDTLSYCDSDVLFLRPFSGLFLFLAPVTEACFMRDSQNAYSVRSRHLMTEQRLRLPARVNTGLIHVRARCFDPDLLEWYLSRPEYCFAPPWVEQTAWALLAGNRTCRLFDPRQIAFPGASTASPSTVALHFVSPLRARLGEVLAHASDRRGEAPVEIRSGLARRLSPLDLAATEARRALRRLFLR
ncbi:MAG: hypothetical protein ABJC13_23555 [Acidobacteriota bacterium]